MSRPNPKPENLTRPSRPSTAPPGSLFEPSALVGFYSWPPRFTDQPELLFEVPCAELAGLPRAGEVVRRPAMDYSVQHVTHVLAGGPHRARVYLLDLPKAEDLVRTSRLQPEAGQ